MKFTCAAILLLGLSLVLSGLAYAQPDQSLRGKPIFTLPLIPSSTIGPLKRGENGFGIHFGPGSWSLDDNDDICLFFSASMLVDASLRDHLGVEKAKPEVLQKVLISPFTPDMKNTSAAGEAAFGRLGRDGKWINIFKFPYSFDWRMGTAIAACRDWMMAAAADTSGHVSIVRRYLSDNLNESSIQMGEKPGIRRILKNGWIINDGTVFLFVKEVDTTKEETSSSVVLYRWEGTGKLTLITIPIFENDQILDISVSSEGNIAALSDLGEKTEGLRLTWLNKGAKAETSVIIPRKGHSFLIGGFIKIAYPSASIFALDDEQVGEYIETKPAIFRVGPNGESTFIGNLVTKAGYMTSSARKFHEGQDGKFYMLSPTDGYAPRGKFTRFTIDVLTPGGK